MFPRLRFRDSQDIGTSEVVPKSTELPPQTTRTKPPIPRSRTPSTIIPFATAQTVASFIEIAPGVYHERIIVTQNHQNASRFFGMGATRPKTSSSPTHLTPKQAGGTFFTETAEINGDAFEADNLTFENTAGNTGPGRRRRRPLGPGDLQALPLPRPSGHPLR